MGRYDDRTAGWASTMIVLPGGDRYDDRTDGKTVQRSSSFFLKKNYYYRLWISLTNREKTGKFLALPAGGPQGATVKNPMIRQKMIRNSNQRPGSRGPYEVPGRSESGPQGAILGTGSPEVDQYDHRTAKRGPVR